MSLFRKILWKIQMRKNAHLFADYYCLPLFLFDYQLISDKVSSSYGYYAEDSLKKALKLVAYSGNLVLLDSLLSYHGDLLDPSKISTILSSPEYSIDTSCVQSKTLQILKSGAKHLPIYIIAVHELPRKVTAKVNRCVKSEGVIGYIGVVSLGINNLSNIERSNIMHSLSLTNFRF